MSKIHLLELRGGFFHENSKRVLACLLAAAMMFSMAGCGGSAALASSAAPAAPASFAPAASSEAPAAPEEKEMTLEELVKAAQDEAAAPGAGSFMVYAPTSRIGKALAAFTEAYGIEGEYYNESGQDLYTKLTTELEANTKDTADVVLMQDSYLFQTQLANYDYIFLPISRAA